MGEAVEAGQQIYKSSSDNKWYLTDNTDSAKVANPAVAGASAAANGYAPIITAGRFNPGGTVVVGEVYCCAPTANKGEWMPIGDAASGAHLTMVAFGYSTSLLEIRVVQFGITHP